MSMRSRIAAVLFSATCAAGAGAQGALVDVVEYYHSGLDHYFVSSLQADIAALDSGTLNGWARTGLTFKAYDAPAPDTSPVCRFYIPPAQGNSHFYSASPAECAEVAAKFPAFSYESPGVMYVGLPDAATGSCPAGWAAVYRLWNNRADSNHRYTTDRSVRADMLTRGYVAEGYGPEGAAMCAPGAGPSLDLVLTSGSLLLMPGDAREVFVVVRPLGGFSGSTTLAVNGLPSGVTAQFESVVVDVHPQGVGVRVRLEAASGMAPTAAMATVTAQAPGILVTSTLSIGVAPTGDPIAVRLRAEADAERRFMELATQGMPLDDVLQTVAAYMAGHPDYVRSGHSREYGTAWGRLKDGTLSMFVLNRSGGDTGSGARTASPLPKAGGPQMPDAPKARLMHAFGEYFEAQRPVNDMRGYLRSRGWTVAQGADGVADVRTLAAAKGDGFFYVNAHGGAHFDDPTNPASTAKQYALVTSMEVDADAEREFAAIMGAEKDKRVVHARAPNGYFKDSATGVRVPQISNYFAITREFVSAYMSFADNSVVFINACFSARDADFVKAFTDAGASVYLGWDGAVYTSSAFRSPPYFVDRMVGANQFAMKESPPQRPFPYDLVLADMDRKGLKRDPTSGANLVAFMGKSFKGAPIFAPSIRYVQVDEANELLTLVGEFGSGTPKVTVGGNERNLKSSGESEIVAFLPQTGPGSSGDVVVEVRGVRSNARQLTEWRLPVSYSYVLDPPTMKLSGTGTMRYRADIAGYRLEPAEPLRYVERGGIATKDSRLTVTASGTFSDGLCSHSLSGAGVYATLSGPPTGMPALKTMFQMDGKSRSGAVHIDFYDPPMGSPLTYTMVCTGGSYTQPIDPLAGLLDGLVSMPADQTDTPQRVQNFALHVKLGASFEIGAINHVEPLTGSNIVNVIRVAWPAATAEKPPREGPDAGR